MFGTCKESLMRETVDIKEKGEGNEEQVLVVDKNSLRALEQSGHDFADHLLLRVYFSHGRYRDF
jgi:hypothetical protein